ncbi:MAG: two-component regulator propeller domain-containing protein [Tenuifilaceae bacterium]
MKENMKIKPLLITVVAFSLIFVFKNLVAQNKSFHFEHITKNNGLASNRVNYIFQDSSGFIWFGTAEGLQKFDGYSFETFQYDPIDTNTVSDNRITCIAKDIFNDNLWIGTENGLNFLDRNTNSISRIISINDSSRLISSQIFSICLDKKKQLWVGTNNGISKIDLKSRRQTNYEFQENNSRSLINRIVYSIFEDKSGQIWIGTRSGLCKYDEKNDNFIKFGNILEDKEIRFIYEDKLGGLWVGTNLNGIYRFWNSKIDNEYANYNMENSELQNNRSYCIAEDTIGNLFIGIRDGGLVYFDFESNTFSPFIPDIRAENSLNSKAIISIFEDRSGIIWIGTYSSGINKIDNHRKKFTHYKVNFKESGLFNNNIRSMFEDSDGNIWIGTKDGGGLSKFDKNTSRFEHFKPESQNPFSLADDYVFSINEIDERYLLVGTFRKGLEILDKRTGKFEHHPEGKSPQSPSSSRIYNIFKDSDNDIWIGTATHLEKFDPISKTFTKCVPISRVTSFYPESKNVFWIGTSQKGLFQYNKKTGKYKSYNNASIDSVSLSSHGVSSLVKDRDGTLWVGSYGGGLYAYDSTGQKRRIFTSKQGLPSNNVCGLLVDERNNIWISSTNGISRFNHKEIKFINYSVQDGLQGNEFENYVALKTRDGRMLFGGNNGFNYFNPSEIKSNLTPPIVVISGFKIFNKPVLIGAKGSPLKSHISKTNEIELKYNYSVITFEFVALNFTSPEKNQYAYKLEGFEKDWNYVGFARNATYTNLEPGEYTFHVKASNNDDVWNEIGTSIKIEVLPPLWKTFWAYLVYAIILLTIMNMLRLYTINRSRARNELLLERLKHEKSDEVNQLKLRFFTNISHEFRTPLTLILGPIQCLIDSDTNEDNKRTLFTIRKNANILLHLVNQLMDLRKIDTGNMRLKATKGDIMKFIEETATSFDMLANDHSIKFLINKSPNQFELWFDQDKIENIVVNLLANAFKFTPDNGEISISVAIVSNSDNRFQNNINPVNQILEIKVKDSGIGIPQDSISEIFNRFYQVKKGKAAFSEGTGIGLSLVKDLVTLLNGEISVESEEAKGSCFTVLIPADDELIDENQRIEEIEPSDNRYGRLRNYAISAFQNIQPATTEIAQIETPNDAPVILVVDDNADIRNYIVQQLQHKYCFEHAVNGAEGIDKAIEFQPDLIISDVLMPEIDGIEFCKRLKSDIQTSHIPIILLTALTSLEYQIEGLETGADAYISKPFSMSLLEVHIKKLIDSRRKLKEQFELDIFLQPKEITINTLDKDFLENVMEVVEKYMSNPEFDVQLFVNEIGMSRTVFYRKLKAVTGMSVNEFINTIRLKRSVQLLKQKKLSVSEIAYEVGFTSPKYFSTCFKKQFHKTPSEFVSES